MMTLRRTMVFAMLTTALGAAWVAGCGDKPAEVPPQPMADAGADVAPAPTPTVTTPPAPVAGPCDAVQSAAMSSMFLGRAVAEAPGMQPEGAPICNVVPEGQVATSPIFTIQQGYCYTILGGSLPPVAELDMQLEVDLAGGAQMPPALAALNIKPLLMTDTEAGGTGSMGAKQSCYKWPLPIPAAVHVTLKSRTGSGPVAAQVYKKKSF
jgi:hypothetical protein